jgi:hypothetical protein
MYVLRVEDVESGSWWLASKRYRDFAAMQQGLVSLWPPTAELAFPQKIIASNRQPAVITTYLVLRFLAFICLFSFSPSFTPLSTPFDLLTHILSFC